MIDTNSIRNKVLELATSGKLTNSLPRDGCIDALYAWIVSEKERIIETGVLKGRKNKEVKEVIDDEMFELPRNWMWIRLGEVVEVFGRIGFRGYTKADIVEADAGAITISPSNIDEKGNMSFDNCTYISWKKYEESPEIQISNDDIIIVKTGSSYGKAGIVKNLPKKATINPQLAVLKYILCNKEYLNIVLNSPMAKKQYEQFVIGAAIPTFSQEKLSNLLMPLPSIEEQDRIVDRVTKVYEILDKIDHLQESYFVDIETLQSKLIDAGIQGKLTEQLPEDGTAQDLYISIQEEKSKLIKEKKIKKEKPIDDITEDEIPFEIPENWKWVRMSEILDVRDGTHDSPQYYDVGIPMITSKNLVSGVLEFENVKYVSEEDAKKINERSAVQDGDILFAMIGTIGNPVLVKKDREFVVKNVALFKKYGNTKLSMEYIYWYLMREQNEFKKIVSGGLQPFISLKQFREHVMPLPPYEEQKRIVNRLETLFESM